MAPNLLRPFRVVALLFAASITSIVPASGDESEVTILFGPQETGKPSWIFGSVDGFLYGTNELGEFFRFRDDGSDLTLLYRFNPENGLPKNSILGKDGIFYGVASNRSKFVIYRLDTKGDYRQLYQFPEQLKRYTHISLTEGADGVLYGVIYSSRVLFRLNKNGTGYKELRKFLAKGDSAPSSPLVYGSNGKLYGTGGGGPNGTGFVYSINPDGSKYQILMAFRSRPKNDKRELADPVALLEGPDGFLYGAAYGGGNHQKKDIGGVFRLDKNGKDYETVRFFTMEDRHPYSLFLGSDTRLYGICNQGGNHNHGMLFSLRRDGTEFRHELQPYAVQQGAHYLSVADEIAPLVFIGSNGGGSAKGNVTYKLKIGVLPPQISVPGGTITTSEAKKRIAGTAKSRVGIESVEYRVNGGEFRLIRGLEHWSFAADLQTGKNEVEIRVRDSRGQESLKSVTVVRK